MSVGSYDESSNLVVEVTSPLSTDNEKDDNVFDKFTCDQQSDEQKLDTPKKKGFGFKKKRAKSPLRSPLKSPLKLPHFKHHKSSKSQLKSPSNDISAEEIKEVEKRIGEKKSEEWQVFQQMQDRIQRTVQQTQSSLTKLSSTDDNTESKTSDKPDEKQKTFSESSWQSSFDDTSSLIPVGNSQTKKKDTSGSLYEENVHESELLDLSLPHLHVTPVPSPRGTPRPPVNSLRTSMENLTSEEASTTKFQEEQDVDLLGLSCDTENANITESQVENYNIIVNQDLLGLDNAILESHNDIGSAYSSSMDGSDVLFGNIGSETSSQRSTPLGFDMWGEDDQTVPVGTIDSEFVSSMVDEFLQLDTMKEAMSSKFNPFQTIDQTLDESLDNLDPFSPKTKTTAMNIPEANPSTDLSAENYSSKKNFFDSFKDETDDSVGLSTSPHVYDNLGFGNSDQKKKAEISEMLQFSPDEQVDETNDISSVNPLPDTSKNPFLTSTEEPALATNNANIASDLFDDDFFVSRSKNMADNTPGALSGDAWGVIEDTTATNISLGTNPFQEDFFTVDNINAEVGSQSASQNPFLSDDISAETLNNNTGAINPFLNLESESKEKSNLNDIDLFLTGTSTVAQAKSSSMDDFDPFSTSGGKEPAAIDNTVLDSKGEQTDLFMQDSNKSTEQDHDKDEDTGFTLEIKPLSESKYVTSEPPPALKPPPPRSKSPQPPRENPFDKESPPEEDFANFEVEEKEQSERRKSFSTSISTDSSTPESFYEENLEPLEPFIEPTAKDGWKMMLRQPSKKKLTANRYWKNVYVKLVPHEDGPLLKLFYDSESDESFQELPLQPCYSLSDVELQHYDQYGKIHTVKMQYVFYKERVGIRPDRITPSFVKKPKPTMILDHSPQVSELLKFGCLEKEEIQSFVTEVEDALMKIEAHREKTLTYTKEEVTAEVWDEYKAILDKNGKILSQKARVRIFFLAFITGMPTCELGINDRRRRGKEVVGRHDIIPIKTEEWIRLEDVEFHCCVDLKTFENTNNIRFHPLDACQFELVRYRVRLRENKELPLQIKVQQSMKERRYEIRCDLLVTGYHSFSKKHGQFPCEDIEIRFPIPQPWIYLFRYERRFGYGSFKSQSRKPGKIKGLERITMIAQGLLSPTLMEADVGVAKYENIYKSIVWRIPRLPERNEGAYTSHLFRMFLDLGSHDEIPDTFGKECHVEFTMPCCSVSQTQIRSVSVENPNPPEKWVRPVAKYEYVQDIENLMEEKEKSSDSAEGSCD